MLGKFSGPERKMLNDACGRAAEAIRMMVSGDADGAMNRFNTKNFSAKEEA